MRDRETETDGVGETLFIVCLLSSLWIKLYFLCPLGAKVAQCPMNGGLAGLASHDTTHGLLVVGVRR